MDLNRSLQEYFQGELHLGIGLAVLGVIILAASLWLWRTQNGAFMLWLLMPLIVMGLGFGAGGAAFAVKTRAQVAGLVEQLKTASSELIAAETSRMAKVNANWPRAKAAWAVLAVIGLILVIFMRRDWSAALGLSILLLTTILMFVDVFGERRAGIYAEVLEKSRTIESSVGSQK